MKGIIGRILSRFVTDNRYATLSRHQIEAFTDLVALAMVIDRHIAQLERAEIARVLSQFEWPEQRPSEHFINRSVQRAWNMLDTDTPEADTLSYCHEIAKRLEVEWLKEAAFVSAVRVIHADAKVEPDEVALLEYMQEAFDLSASQIEILTERASHTSSS